MKRSSGLESGGKRVGVWLRVSTEDQVRGESPEHHEKRARFYAESKGWHIVEVYRLDALSGKSVMGYDETRRMLADIRRGHITGLIFSKLARLARNTKELLDFADIFEHFSADLISLQESIDTSTPAGRLFYTMIAAMAQWEREEIAERVAASVPVRARMGKSTGGAAPFGYKWQNNQLLVEPSEAPVRRLMYELFAEHRRTRTVARILNERGYRSRGGKPWSYTTVIRLIKDPTSKGLHRANYTKSLGQGKQWNLKPESDWVWTSVEPIVPESLWDECNAQFADRPKRPAAKKPVHLFAGVAICECGERMYVLSNYKTKYVCRKCRNKIGINDLEVVFTEQLKAFLLSPTDVAAYLDAANETLTAKQAALSILEKERAKALADSDRIMKLYLADRISQDGFAARNDPLEARLKQLNDELPRLQGEVDFLRLSTLSGAEIAAEGQDLYTRFPTLPAADKRSIVEAITERITIGSDSIDISLLYLPHSSKDLAKKQHINRDS